MSGQLVAGANAPITGETVRVRIDAGNAVEFGVAVLPEHSSAASWLSMQEPTPGYIGGQETARAFDMALGAFPAAVERVTLALYSSVPALLRGLSEISIDIGGHAIAVGVEHLAASAIVFADLYRRNGAWKVRARNDAVFDGVEELGRRIGVTVTDTRRSARPTPTRTEDVQPPRHSGQPSHDRRRQADWSGSGSLIGDRYLVTNAHVVDDASEIVISSFAGRVSAQPVIVDATNDLALLRLAEGVEHSEIRFRATGPELGESAVTLGYPLHGLLGSGPQFTQGSVSNLIGLHDDVRYMQITCPVQPGSSGGPVFDRSGLLIGVVTAAMQGAQNVNFAARASLVQALLEAAGVPFVIDRRQPLETQELVRMNSASVWRVECFR